MKVQLRIVTTLTSTRLTRRRCFQLAAGIALSATAYLSAAGCGGHRGSQLDGPFRTRWSQTATRNGEAFQRFVASDGKGTVYAFAGPSEEASVPSGVSDTVYALDPRNGTIRWRFAMESVTRRAGAADKGAAAATAGTAGVAGPLSRATAGASRAQSRAQSALVTQHFWEQIPLFYASDRTVVVRLNSAAGVFRFYGLDVATGAVRWSSDDTVYPVYADAVGSNRLVTLSTTRREIRLLEAETGNIVQRIAWTGDSDIQEVDGLPDAVLAFDGTRLACFDAATGAERWSLLSAFHYVQGDVIFTAPGQDLIYAVVDRGVLARLDPQTGGVIWGSAIVPQGSSAGVFQAALGADGAALVWENGTNQLHVFDPATGGQRWTYYLGAAYPSTVTGQGVSSSVAAGGTVYAVTTKGTGLFRQTFDGSALAALDLSTGQERWRVDSPSRELYGPPALTKDGGLVFLEGDRVACLEGQ